VNAVFERDYVRTSVSRPYLFLRAGFGLCVALMVAVLAFGAFAHHDFTGVGESVLRYTMMSGLLLVVLAVPGSFGASLVHPRAQNALPILLASPLSPLSVAWGAFVSRALGYGIFVFACWPPVAIALTFGGIRPPQLVLATAALLGTLLLLAAPAFLISAFARSTGPAIVASYVAGGALLTALWAVGERCAATQPFLATSLSPVHAIDWAVEPGRAVKAGSYGAWLLPVWGLLAAAVSVGISAWRLQLEARGSVESAVATVAKRGYRPLRRENPVLDHELRTAGLRRSQSAGRTVFLVLVLSEIAYVVTAVRTDNTDFLPLFAGFLLFQTSILVLAAAAAGATSLAAERETGTLDVVRVTPLTTREIVEGKLLGLFRALLPALAVPSVHLAWGAAHGFVSWLAIPAYLVAGAIVSSTWVIFGMSQSLDQRDPQRAVKRTMGLIGIIGFALGGYVGFVLSSWAEAKDLDTWVRLPLSYGANPAGATLAWVGALRTGGSDAESSALPPPGAGEQALGLIGGGAWLLLHILVAWMVFRRLQHLYRTRFEG